MKPATRRSCRISSVISIAVSAAVFVTVFARPAIGQTLYPRADGTLLDGGLGGYFDGFADEADWSFNESSYEGAISLVTDPSSVHFEHRVVWEYDISSVTYELPLTAHLRFVIRGAPAYPRPDVTVHVYSYPADLIQGLSDFAAGLALLQGEAVLSSYQQPTVFTLNVSNAVNSALASGEGAVGFRFQVDPFTVNLLNQAFMDVLDADPTSKPALMLEDTRPGDSNGDDLVDLADFADYVPCMSDPHADAGGECTLLDLDDDSDVDLRDYASFQLSASFGG